MGQINLEIITYKSKQYFAVVMRVKEEKYYASYSVGWTKNIMEFVPVWNLNNREQAEADYRIMIAAMKQKGMIPNSDKILGGKS